MSHSSNGGEVLFYTLVGGPALLAWGISCLKEERLIQDTPLSKVRSAAMGLVALQGVAKPRREIAEPIDHAPCCWWRCCVEEYRSNGKSGSWVTVKEVASQDLLYLQDDTGKVLVDPDGAELYISDKTVPLNSSTQPTVEPLLASWGINDKSWFGTTKQMRLIETVIFPDFPLYVLGALDRCTEFMDGRQQRLAQHMEAVKQDPQKMASARGSDGAIDPLGWDMLMRKEQAAFVQAEQEREAQIPDSDKMAVRKPQDQPFVVSTKSEEDLARSFGYKAFFMILGGIAVAGLGTALALAHGFSTEWTAALVVGGFIAGMVLARVLKKGGARRDTWHWSSWS